MVAIAILSGGTGGHVMPALALAEELEQLGIQLHWFGRPNSLEARMAQTTKAQYWCVDSQGFRGKSGPDKLKGLWSLFVSVCRCWWLLFKMPSRPQMAVGFGGYVSLAPALAFWLWRIPLALHEQNARTGTANRLLRKRARLLFAGLPGAFGVQSGTSSEQAAASGGNFIGNPVRRQLRMASQETFASASSVVRLLIFGGSQGAQAINDQVADLATALPADSWEIWHLCGALPVNKLRALKGRYTKLARKIGVPIKVEAFSDQMDEIYRWADIVLCRSGALTLSELALFSLPAVLVPLPNAIDNHQMVNAEIWRDAGAASVAVQSELEPVALAAELQQMAQNLSSMKAAATRLARPDAARRMAQKILASIRGTDSMQGSGLS
ncbi:MAG: UDP-N-acetylglucosamine--N-acetylmuramyl-(pentapeptide) pyrophosphoryl-undecaprenol N-acetylglucosamine transferase [Gammaproteobacteria bacterium]